MPAVAHILHAWGGGSEKHVSDLTRLLPLTSYVIKPYDPNSTAIFHGDTRQIVPHDNLVEFLKTNSVDIIHIHQLIGHSINYPYVAELLGARLYITLHDYFYLCPKFQLLTADSKYCGLPKDVQVCDSCSGRPVQPWRDHHREVLQQANQVIAPSLDVYHRFKEWLPNANYVVVPHDEWYRATDAVKQPQSDLKTILLLGTLSPGKGAHVLEELVNKVREEKLPIRFKLLGKSEIPITEDEIFSQTGPYQNTDEHQLINEINPDAILFPAIWPETYSYTLSSAIRSLRPIIAPKIGAFIERLAGRNYTKLYGAHEEIIDTILNLDKLDKDPTEIDYSMIDFDFYQTEYF